jgi:hypothetical protein
MRELPQRRRDLLLGNTTTLKSDGGVRYGRSLDRSDRYGYRSLIQVRNRGFGDDGKSGIPLLSSYDITKWEKNDGHNDVGLPTVNAKAMN